LGSAPWSRFRWSDEVTRRLLLDQIIASGVSGVIIALLLIGTDVIAEHMSQLEWLPDLRLHPTLLERAGFVHALLTLFGLPTTVLVALTSFAVPVLRPSATVGALLLHRPYLVGRWDQRELSFMRSNPFYGAFVTAAGLSLALLVLSFGVAAELLRAQLPALLLATLVAALAGFRFISAIVWTLRMRDGMALVSHVTELGENVIAHAGAGGASAAPFEDRSPGGRFSFVEQVELRQCVDTLTQQALHVGDEPAASAAALRGLRRLQEAAIGSGAVALWRERPGVLPSPFPDPWLEADVISTLTRAIIAAVRARDAAAGQDAIAILGAIGIDLAEAPNPSPTDRRVMDLVLQALRLCFEACVEGRELVLRERLIAQLDELIERLSNVGASAIPGFRSGVTS
jgi:hypothetical protein